MHLCNGIMVEVFWYFGHFARFYVDLPLYVDVDLPSKVSSIATPSSDEAPPLVWLLVFASLTRFVLLPCPKGVVRRRRAS